MPVDHDQNDQNQMNLKVKFNNVYVFPFKSMYTNKFPTQAAEQPTTRWSVRRFKKPASRRQKTVLRQAQPVAQLPVAQPPVVQPPVVQPPVVQPPVQSGRTLRATLRAARRAARTAN